MARETVKVTGLREVQRAIEDLAKTMGDKASSPIRAALRDGAKVLVDEAKANVRRIIDEPNARGEDESTGLLLISIRAATGRMPPGRKGEAIVIGVKRGVYPANRQAKKEQWTAVQIGRLLEEGSERRAPMPWLRPAFDAKKNEAVRVFKESVTKRVEKLIKRMARIGAP
jgi:HK97 gp10 family phage protein